MCGFMCSGVSCISCIRCSCLFFCIYIYVCQLRQLVLSRHLVAALREISGIEELFDAWPFRQIANYLQSAVHAIRPLVAQFFEVALRRAAQRFPAATEQLDPQLRVPGRMVAAEPICRRTGGIRGTDIPNAIAVFFQID